MTKKIIIITYESGKEEAIEYKIEALEYIEANIAWITDFKIIEMTECDYSVDTSYEDELMPDTSNYDGDWQPYRSLNR
jgi:hypothetical protein